MRAALLLVLALAPLASAAQTPATRVDPNSPDNAARKALIESLDHLAATQTAARRAEIAKIHTQAQARARQAHVRETMLRLIGPLPTRTPLNAQVLGTTNLPGVRIEKLLYDSQPNFHVTALLYLPDVPQGTKLPAIVMAPGHSPAGKAGDSPFALAFARAGIAVLSYDPLGQGERLQYPDPASAADHSVPGKTLAKQPTGEHGEASLQPILLGETLAKYMLWDGMTAVDYLQTRPEIDPTRIGAFGCSGGGAMTALLGALDPRIAATGTACYITSFDTLLPIQGPQDGEQSTPGWLSNGLDFPDWIELASPRPYAIISTTEDMFPFAGAQSTEAESRRFYSLFTADKSLAFITGPGHHGNLKPILPQIIQFFATNLHAVPPAVQGTDIAPREALQVTPTGQVSTSYPNTATVFTLNLAGPGHKMRQELRPNTGRYLEQNVRDVLVIPPPTPGLPFKPSLLSESSATAFLSPDTFTPSPPHKPGAKFAAVLLLTNEPITQPAEGQDFTAIQNRFMDLVEEEGKAALLLSSRPSPAGSEELKTPLLGPYYLLGLRAELVGKTLLGLRVEDTLQAIDELASLPNIDPTQITAEASNHEALILLHAAVLDPRLKHITLHNLPPTYAQLLATPIPKDAPQDILPGVLLHYDIPDLIRALGPRVTIIPEEKKDNQTPPK
ncbi:alpha/beta hydrolase family protein [Granulicella tundricola]|uniref:Acetyl xylan esterase n=1 Tax=Granulicella tundricola (strain ATCC BAA-1859 / DSM 23138 / MP5ACTX9) TaxID=1198114 RepID=E8X0I9_GRATM|nr:acetylxylan esterase [Granulicella tundricola]ADW67853.1 Acetyl xylan esterase [Granulicella tundricola MP5ACTX9]